MGKSGSFAFLADLPHTRARSGCQSLVSTRQAEAEAEARATILHLRSRHPILRGSIGFFSGLAACRCRRKLTITRTKPDRTASNWALWGDAGHFESTVNKRNVDRRAYNQVHYCARPPRVQS
jgi:hypothetical protein